MHTTERALDAYHADLSPDQLYTVRYRCPSIRRMVDSVPLPEDDAWELYQAFCRADLEVAEPEPVYSQLSLDVDAP